MSLPLKASEASVLLAASAKYSHVAPSAPMPLSPNSSEMSVVLVCSAPPNCFFFCKVRFRCAHV